MNTIQDPQSGYLSLIYKYSDTIVDSIIVCENHHILPKCIEIINQSHNMVRLPIKDHLEAHRLLWLIYLGTKHEFNLWFSYYKMFLKISGKNNEEFSILRKKQSEYMFKFWKDPEKRKKLSESKKEWFLTHNTWNYGKNHSEETKEKM